MNEIRRNIIPEWGALIPARELIQAIKNVASLEGDNWRKNIAPPPHFIMEAFRYERPEGIKVVILGQDPYPSDLAQGLSFSVSKGWAIPGSLRNILRALSESNLRSRDAPLHGDLRIWAVQGVLLLNTSLTTRLNVTRAHNRIWKNFTIKILRNFCDFRRRQTAINSLPSLHFLLWGNDARKYSSMIRNYGHIVHEWTHPSDLADARLPLERKFRFCPHFLEVDKALRATKNGIIHWDPLTPILGFTDGACKGNGQKNAQGGFAVVLVGARFNGVAKATTVQGPVAPFQYNLADGSLHGGFRPSIVPATPTNNRAELLALCWCLFIMFKTGLRGRLHIISDSQISLTTLREWLPKRRVSAKSKSLKNMDLLSIADLYYQELLKSAYSVEMHWVHAHQPPPPPGSLLWNKLLYYGNFRADKIATRVLNHDLAQEKSSGFESISMSNPPPILKNFLEFEDCDP